MTSIYSAVSLLGKLWLVMLLVIFAVGGRKSDQDDRGSSLLIIAALSPVLPIIQYMDPAKTALGRISWGDPLVSYLGFLLFFLGLIVHLTGILTLKKQWTTMVAAPEGRVLVEKGIYQFIRHPVYAGILLELLGFGLALANWVSILILIVPNAASFTYRIVVEEKALERYFGADYLSYERKTKRLIPGLF